MYAQPESHLTASIGHNSSTKSVKDISPPIRVSTEAPSSPRLDEGLNHQKYQPFVFTDPVAFRYLEEDPSTTVLARRSRLEGYELYIVEQWACSRVHPTFVITTFTGDPSHSVVVSVLRVPTDEEIWSPRLRLYFKAVSQSHAREKQTPLGILMVTNLSGFPSALTVIAVPEGDVKSHREDFIVNENLKRLGCSGRASLTLAPPASATKAKFYQLYRTSDGIPLYNAVIELVKLCQLALTVFSKLAAEYADGLLCDVTERAINDWWREIGTEFYNLEPSDGILGPTTVAALLGTLMGARNRLNAFGAPVPKDAFDLSSLKRGITHFQKSQKLDRTRRLDRQTLGRLHRLTAKVANGDGWIMRKAVKSTVAELSGKGGEMVMGMVGARDKAGIGEIETVDIEQFIQLVRGERAKWLWYGKQRKTGPNEAFNKFTDDRRMVFSNDEYGGYSTKRDSVAEEGEGGRKKDGETGSYARNPSVGSLRIPADKEQHLKKNMFKSVTGRMNDARSGLGRIKDAVGRSGLRGHYNKQSKEFGTDFEADCCAVDISHLQRSDTVPSAHNSPLGVSHSQKLEQDVSGNQCTSTANLQNQSDPRSSSSSPFLNKESTFKDHSSKNLGSEEDALVVDKGMDGVFDDSGHEAAHQVDNKPSVLETEVEGGLLLRTQSFSCFVAQRFESRNEHRWPRHLSFSDAEEAVLIWDEIGLLTDNTNEQSSEKEAGLVVDAQRMHEQILTLESQVVTWVEQKLADVECLEVSAIRNREDLQALHHQHVSNYQAIYSRTRDILDEEQERLAEAIKDVEILGAKLEYEVNSLITKVEDVEGCVADFERLVLNVEARVGDLEAEEDAREGWLQWASRFFTRGAGLGGYWL